MKYLTIKDVPERQAHDFSNSVTIKTLEIQDKAKITDTKSGDFVIEKSPVITSEIDTQEYIESFVDDVGIENILKKFALTHDPELLNQVSTPTVPIDEDGKQVIQDYTGLPDTEEAALKMAVRAKEEFGNLPPELVGNRSFAEFAENFTQDELIAYIKTLNTKDGGKEDVK